MKKALIWCMLLVLALGGAARAEEVAEAHVRDYEPAAGTGWMVVEIYGETIEMEYTGFTKGMTGTTYSFAGGGYTLSIMFDSKLKEGETGGENSVKQLEIVSSLSATSGYYFVKKATGKAVDSEVTLVKKDHEGLWQGTFRVMAHPGDRYLGDSKPGIIEDLLLENGEFCFRAE